ncbi:MAG TPA: WD40 repeat domain-containing serine/threonine-protein kinase, partial [Allocoleopsis sp.]
VTKMFLGTYRYAAPEQFEVDQDLDERADIYSLGVVIYEMLSGNDPFGFGEPGRQKGGGTWAVAHLTKPVLSLRQHPGCEQLPPDVEAIVMQCLEKAPDRRFASVYELDQALRAATQGWIDCPPQTHWNPESAQSSLNSLNPPPALVPLERLGQPLVSWQPSSESPVPSDVLTQDVNPVFSTVVSGTAVSSPAVSAPSLSWVGQVWRSCWHPVLQHPFKASLLLALLVLSGVYYSVRSHSGISAAAPSPLPVQSSSPPIQATVRSLTGHTDTVWAIATHPDSNTIASGSFDKTIRLWDLQTGQLIRTFTGHRDAVRSVALSADGKTLVSGSGDKMIKVWDLATGKLRRTLMGHAGPVWTVALSPDAKTIVSGSYDGTIKLWDLNTGKLLHTLPEHYDSVWSVTVSPNGKLIASGAYDGTIKIWDLQTGQLLRTLTGHT